MLRLSLILALCAVPALADNLICTGDSQTNPTYLADSEKWCSIMAAATGRSALNVAVPGSRSVDVLARFATDMLNPGRCVTIMTGIVDGTIDPAGAYDYSQPWHAPRAATLTPAETQANLVAMVGMAKAAGKEVTLLTPWPELGPANLSQMPFYTDAVKAASVLTGTPLLDPYEMLVRRIFSSSRWSAPGGYDLLAWYREGDIVHPSAIGHAEIAALCSLPQNRSACACRPS